MPFVRGQLYSRAEICAAYAIPCDGHAVLVRAGEPVALVVNEHGRNPYNGEWYSNALEAETFTMQGENDDRGALLERRIRDLDLFFRKNGETKYCYEAAVRFIERLRVHGSPIRKFARIV